MNTVETETAFGVAFQSGLKSRLNILYMIGGDFHGNELTPSSCILRFKLLLRARNPHCDLHYQEQEFRESLKRLFEPWLVNIQVEFNKGNYITRPHWSVIIELREDLTCGYSLEKIYTYQFRKVHI